MRLCKIKVNGDGEMNLNYLWLLYELNQWEQYQLYFLLRYLLYSKKK